MRYRKLYPATLAYSAALFLLAFLLDTPDNIRAGMRTILLHSETLITDYIAIAGLGAALVNSALVTLASLLILYLVKDPANGFSITVLGLMSGFSLFGKNIFAMWPFLIGAFLYAILKKQPLGSVACTGLLTSALSPLVSFVCFGGERITWVTVLGGILLGVVIGFLLPALSAYTAKLQNGMNLYNMGFACGMIAIVVIALMTSLGHTPKSASYWATGYNTLFACLLSGFCLILIAAGCFLCRCSPKAAWKSYWALLRSSGRSPSDFLLIFGPAATLINMGVCGLISTAYILFIQGDLNGPTVGGVITIMGFAAFGKHAANIVPIMAGVLVGDAVMQWNVNDHGSQLAGLYGTALAPISGYFGWPYGILAGLLHSCVVLRTGALVCGANLYNNGFSSGLISIILFPILLSLTGRRKSEDRLEPPEPTPASGKRRKKHR